MPRHARKTDPTTSHEAAASTTEEQLSNLEYAVLYYLKQRPLKDEDLVTQILGSGYLATPQGVRTARNRLGNRGLIQVVGLQKTKYGRNARVWFAA